MPTETMTIYTSSRVTCHRDDDDNVFWGAQLVSLSVFLVFAARAALLGRAAPRTVKRCGRDEGAASSLTPVSCTCQWVENVPGTMSNRFSSQKIVTFRYNSLRPTAR
ncbi:hypothetical protein EYF80_050660 [Liparis tanakae]|uniref:Uncharacterized protein n=1 Tax=Liparis tanakae TaxID=230148 RepID=A0A4Z2FFI0_9TELE|nr:hypothetical protein EYF80_050660 [Liparis tanakae]